MTFSAPRTISEVGSTAGEFAPTISAGPEGNVYIAWTANTPGNSSFSVFFRRSTDGGATFSAPLTISNAGFDARLGQMAVDGNGTVTIVWSDSSPGNGKYALFFSHSVDAGATFSAPLNLSNNPDVSSVNVQMSVNSNGNVDVLWSDSGGPFFAPFSEALFTRSVDGGATFSAPLIIDSVTGNGPEQPVAMIPVGVSRETNGNINLLWSRAVSNGDCFMDDVRFSRSTDGGGSFWSSVQIDGAGGGAGLRRWPSVAKAM